MRRTLIPTALAVVLAAAACQGSPSPPAQSTVQAPPSIPDAQTAVDAPLFVGQSAFPAPLGQEADYGPSLSTARVDGGNSGVVDGAAPLGVAPVTGSAELPLQAPLLWGRGGLISGCQITVGPGVSKNCLAAVDTSTFAVEARWSPPGQDLDLATAVLDGSDRALVTTEQGHLFVVGLPDGEGGTFQVIRDIDLSGHLGAGQGLLSSVADSDGNLWFTSGGPSPAGQPATSTTVGYVTPGDQVVTTTLPDQLVETGLAVDQEDVYVVTVPSGAATTGSAPAVPATAGAGDESADQGQVYDLTANANQVQTVWREPYDAGSSVKPGGTIRGTGSPVVLLGSQYLALTDNADGQTHLLIYLRGALPARGATTTTTSTTAANTTAAITTAATTTAANASTAGHSSKGGASVKARTTAAVRAAPSTTTTTPGGTAPASTGDPRLVCSVGLFTPGASAVTTAAIGYSSGDTNSVIVANGYDTPPPLASPSDDGPANDIDQMPGGVTRVDVLADGSGCRTEWTVTLRLEAAPVLSTATGLIYGYTEDQARAATGSYVWYFVGIDYRTGTVIWQQRAGAGSTKNDDGLPTVVGANGVLYQCLPLGLVWMHDVGQVP